VETGSGINPILLFIARLAPAMQFFAMQSSQPTTLELNDFHLRRLSDADPRAELFDAGLAPIRWDVPPAFVWMTQGLIDWRPEGSPVIVRRSPAEQLLRGAQGSDRPAWSDNRDESCQDELAPRAYAGHVGNAGIRAIGRGGASREARVRFGEARWEVPDFVPIQRVLGICPTAGLSGPRCPPERPA
jgi:hypothetical protein